MKSLIYLLAGCIFISGCIGIDNISKGDYQRQNKKIKERYLPVCLLVNKLQKGDFYFYLGASFKRYSIKLVSKEESNEMCNLEIKNVYEFYYRTREGEKADFEEIKRKAASDLSYVVNIVEINFKNDSVNNSIDSIQFHIFPAPVNMGNMYKSKWVNFGIADKKQYTLIELSNAIADSVINTNSLFKEK